MAQGSILTGQQAAAQIYNSDRDYQNRLTWQNMLRTNDLSAGRMAQQLENEYASATVDAYTSYLSNKAAVENSALVGSGKNLAMEQADQVYSEAYQSYMNSLVEGQTQVENARAQQEQAILDAMSEQGENIAAYNNLHWDYLNKLWEDYTAGENDIFSGENGTPYLFREKFLKEVETDENGVPVDENAVQIGNKWYILNDRDELAGRLYNEDGTLTEEGIDFYDSLENAAANGLIDAVSWGDYLSETNPELFDWANAYNPYNYTFDGTNAGSFNTMVGRASSDNRWYFAERYGGFDGEQLNKMFADFTANLDETFEDYFYDVNFAKVNKGKLNKLDNLQKGMSEALEGLKEDLESVGIDSSEIEEAMDLITSEENMERVLAIAQAKIEDLEEGKADSSSIPAWAGGAIGSGRLSRHQKALVTQAIYKDYLKNVYTDAINRSINETLRKAKESQSK